MELSTLSCCEMCASILCFQTCIPCLHTGTPLHGHRSHAYSEGHHITVCDCWSEHGMSHLNLTGNSRAVKYHLRHLAGASMDCNIVQDTLQLDCPVLDSMASTWAALC